MLSVAQLRDAESAALEEVFGSSAVVVRYDDVDQLATRLAAVEGQLTASLHYGPDRVQRLADRVAVGHAMVHGGPYPATSDGRTTSVGSLAIERFQRPVCYQDVPAELLSESVRDDNPWGLARRVDGALEGPTRRL